ncbi:energy transducer TonB [Flavobacterium sp.]|jgi:hypothetical protein|uniref:energy transducer TonB n=1 Tax=Flavobacterium sp. TaxID=239 RepID=UPI004048BCD3
MKLFSGLFLLIFLSTTSFSQEKDRVVDSKDEIMPLTIVEQAPGFPNCKGIVFEKSQECFQTELMNHVKKNFVFPEDAIENRITVKLLAKFIIDENGIVVVQEIIGPPQAESIKEELRRTILKLPKFEPAKHKGKVVKVKHTFPLTYSLQ